MTKEELREKANDLPLLPGVYLMMDKTGKVIYVGKAKKLKNRVSQYFQDTASHNEKTRAMVSQVDHFDTIFVSSEFEALILENSLIKRHQPRYNILLKDDKGYPFIRLDTGASYPRFTLAGKAEEDGARYFGPFGGRRETRLAIEAVCGALKLPICSRQFPRDIGKERPCLNHHIGRCDGFCLPGGPDQTEYRRRIRQAERIFSGHYRQLTAELQTEMEDAAEELNFEKAAALRDRIRAISVLGKQQQVIAGVCADTDVWGVYVGQVRSGCAVLHIEDGNLLGREVEVFPTAADEALPAVLAAVLQQYYLERGALPSEILLPEPVEDMETLAALLTGRAGHRVTLRVPQRGERAELLRMAGRNAREEVERITSDAERVNKTLEQLQQLADLPVLPRRMESYDISHTAGQDMVASMVVFVDGKPLKRDYRRFQIKTLDHADDLRALQEVLQRRMQRYLDGDEHFSPLPDLLLLNAHLLKHIMGHGVGLRQFCDMARAYHALHGSYSPVELEAAYRRTGLLRWSAQLHTFLTEHLGLPRDVLPYAGTDARTSPRLLHIVLEGGNFGQYGKTRAKASRAGWERKLHTFLSFWRHRDFSGAYARGEAFWTSIRLITGNLR